MEPEYGGRNWDYNGADHIFPITDAGIGFTVFCNAAKNNNQRVLDIESDGGLPYRSIHIGLRWISPIIKITRKMTKFMSVVISVPNKCFAKNTWTLE